MGSGGSLITALVAWSGGWDFKPLYCKAATGEPFNKALNLLSSKNAVSKLILSPSFPFAKKRTSLSCIVYVTNRGFLTLKGTLIKMPCWDNYKKLLYFMSFFDPLLIYGFLFLERDDALYLKTHVNVIHFLVLVSH